MSSKKAPLVTCPQCGAEVVWDSKLSPFRPFCSERCKLIDLGQWANEDYRVPLEHDSGDDTPADPHQA